MSLRFDGHYGTGPSPNFTQYHIWKCYETVAREQPVGRRKLSAILKLGEGSTRTLLDRMVREGLMKATPRGMRLSARGRERFDAIGLTIMALDRPLVSIGRFNCAVHVHGGSARIKDGTEQRDAAVRAGAESAITLVMRDSKLVYPTDERFPDQSIVGPFISYYQIQSGDVVIVGGASAYEAAERGAVSAALALVGPEEESWDDQNRVLSRDYEEEDMKSIALMVHEMVGRLPLTMRSKNHYGVRCEDGRIIESNFTGPVLEEALRKGRIVRRISKAGKYRGCPVLAVPLVRGGKVVAVVGVFDTTRGSYYEWLGRVKR